MPLTFSFDANNLITPTYLDRADFTKGAGPGVNDPTQYSAIASGQAIDYVGDVDVFAITLVAGQSYTFDIDDGYGDATGGSIDLQLDVIDQAGLLVASSDNPTSTTRDPLLGFTATRTGTFFVAVHHASNDYVNGHFAFAGTGGNTGDYSLVVSTPTLPAVTTLTNYGDSRTFSDYAQTVKALAGNDTLSLLGGNDLALGGDGNDSILGGLGDDELNGGRDADRLWGNEGDDVLIGGTGWDSLSGGSGRDSLSGGTGNDALNGGSGNDILWGEAGDDRLDGSSGNDLLRGGAGVDVLTGGTGADIFHFLPGEAAYDAAGFNEDRIQDFESGDRIDLSDLLLGTLAWRGTGAFTAANQARVNDLRGSIGYQEVQVNLDTDATPEFALLVDTLGNVALAQGDFIL